MKKQRKQRLSLVDVITRPVTPVVNKTGYKTKAEFFAAEKDAAEKPVRDAIEVQRQAFLKRRKLASEFWSRRPVSELNLNHFKDSAVDLTFAAPRTTDREYTTEEFNQACENWYDHSLSKSGHLLSPDGVLRLCAFSEIHARAGYDFSQPATWQAAFDYLAFNLKAFGDELDSSRVPRQSEPPAPQPTLDDIENLALESTDGRKQALKIVEELASAEASVICGQWLEQLKRDYDFTPDTKQINEVVRWFNFNAKNWLRHKCYDECRRSLVSQGIFPDIRTNDEREAALIEAGPALATLGFDDRVALKNRIRRLSDRVF
jgi:hypothetical protein